MGSPRTERRDTTGPGAAVQLLDEILRAAPDGYLLVDDTGVITFTNSTLEQMFGYPPGGLLGHGVEVLVPAAQRAGHAAQRQRFAHTGGSRPMGAGLDLWGVRRDGSSFEVEVALDRVHLGGEPCTLAIVRDISERRRITEGVHDDVLQDLFGVAMSLRAAAIAESSATADRVGRAADHLESVMGRLRAVTSALRAPNATARTLTSDVLARVAQTRSALGPVLALHLHGPLDFSVPQPTAAELLSVLDAGLDAIERGVAVGSAALRSAPDGRVPIDVDVAVDATVRLRIAVAALWHVGAQQQLEQHVAARLAVLASRVSHAGAGATVEPIEHLYQLSWSSTLT